MTIRRVGPARRQLAFALAVVAVVLAETLLPQALAGQVSPAATSPQMRHFWHVFAAYAIAWVLLFGWIVSVARRLAKVEKRIDG